MAKGRNRYDSYGGVAEGLKTSIIRVVCVTIAAGALLLGCEGVDEPDRPLVFVLSGQSNMVGQGASADLTVEQLFAPDSVRHFDGLEPLTPGTNARFGPELSLGQSVAAAMPYRAIRIVKYARGGTSLLAWAPQWDSTRATISRNAEAGPLYADLIGIVDSLTSNEDVEIGAVFWMQGERDARFQAAGVDYFANLSHLIESLRKDLGIPDLPFILGLVNPPAETYPAREIVRIAQRKAATEIPNVSVVDTDDLTKWDDNLHYDTAGILELGRRFAAAFLETAAS